MTLSHYILFAAFLIIFYTNTSGEFAKRPVWFQQLLSNDIYYKQPHVKKSDEKVKIQLFYEVFCGDCRDFDTSQFKEVILKLNKYLNILTYPYGNANTVVYKNGTVEFYCQHGPNECYGNKLHACALNLLKNHTEALLYNICMMDFSQADQGSDDNAAQKCGGSMKINSKPIEECAKSKKGDELLEYYGVESKNVNFNYVPYVLLNGKEYNGTDFIKDVCATYAKPPPPCRHYAL